MKKLTSFLLLLSLLIVGHAANASKAPFGLRIYEIGNAVNFKLNNTDGETFELNSTRGQWVFLHFWASWCGPCREEMPTIQKLSEAIEDSQLKIVMVNTAEDEDTIFTFLAGISVEIDTRKVAVQAIARRIEGLIAADDLEVKVEVRERAVEHADAADVDIADALR